MTSKQHAPHRHTSASSSHIHRPSLYHTDGFKLENPIHLHNRIEKSTKMQEKLLQRLDQILKILSYETYPKTDEGELELEATYLAYYHSIPLKDIENEIEKGLMESDKMESLLHQVKSQTKTAYQALRTARRYFIVNRKCPVVPTGKLKDLLIELDFKLSKYSLVRNSKDLTAASQALKESKSDWLKRTQKDKEYNIPDYALKNPLALYEKIKQMANSKDREKELLLEALNLTLKRLENPNVLLDNLNDSGKFNLEATWARKCFFTRLEPLEEELKSWKHSINTMEPSVLLSKLKAVKREGQRWNEKITAEIKNFNNKYENKHLPDNMLGALIEELKDAKKRYLGIRMHDIEDLEASIARKDLGNNKKAKNNHTTKQAHQELVKDNIQTINPTWVQHWQELETDPGESRMPTARKRRRSDEHDNGTTVHPTEVSDDDWLELFTTTCD